MSARVEGIPQLKRQLRKLETDIEIGGREGKRIAASELAEEWRRGAPVRTGAHQRGIRSDADSAFATARHSVFVEFGSSTHVAHHDGRAGAARAAPKIPGIIARRIKRRLR